MMFRASRQSGTPNCLDGNADLCSTDIRMVEAVMNAGVHHG